MCNPVIKEIHNEILFKTNFHFRTQDLMKMGAEKVTENFKRFKKMSNDDFLELISDVSDDLPETKALFHAFDSARNAVYQKYRTCLRRLNETEDMTTYDHSQYNLPHIDLKQGDYIGNTKYRFIELLPFEFLRNHTDSFSLGFIARNEMTCACCQHQAKYFIHSVSHKRHNYGLYTEKMEPLTVDHIIPRAQNGRNSEYNYQVLCQYCNVLKGDMIISIPELRKLVDKKRPGFVKYYIH